MHATIQIESKAAAAWVWLNRPEVRNAFNDVMIGELTETLLTLGEDPSVKVLVLAGRGPTFCALKVT